MECVVEPRQGARERFSLLGEFDTSRGRDEKLRAHHVLETLDLPAYRRLARVGHLRGPVERLGLGHGQKDAKFTPKLSAQERRFIERALVEGLLFLVEREHGFHRADGTIAYSLSVSPAKSPLTSCVV